MTLRRDESISVRRLSGENRDGFHECGLLVTVTSRPAPVPVPVPFCFLTSPPPFLVCSSCLFPSSALRSSLFIPAFLCLALCSLCHFCLHVKETHQFLSVGPELTTIISTHAHLTVRRHGAMKRGEPHVIFGVDPGSCTEKEANKGRQIARSPLKTMC